MESGNQVSRKSRSRREGKEEISGQVLAGSIIDEIEKLDAVGNQTRQAVDECRRLVEDIKSYKLVVDTDALADKKKEFTGALEEQIRQIRRSTRTLRTVLWLFVVMLSLVFIVGYCHLSTQQWQTRYLQLEQQYNELQTQNARTNG